MEIGRDIYLQRLIDRKHNGMIKIITGIRRCGKSFLLFNLFKRHLVASGVPEKRIIRLELDSRRYAPLRAPDQLLKFVNEKLDAKGQYYLFIDEVQLLDDFSSVLNELLRRPNADIYVTGSNSKFLSSDVLTEFRGRGDEVRLHPLAFSEFAAAFKNSPQEAWQEYLTYGGLPQLLSMKSDEQKSSYLDSIFNTVYIRDIRERHHIRHQQELGELLDVLASSVGSLTNPLKLANTFRSERRAKLPESTLARYCDYLTDAFLLDKAKRYDLRGKSYINTPFKLYFEDVGLRNARLNFRQIEENRLMENIVYNELRYRGYKVDVGVVDVREKRPDGKYSRKQTEIDFVANLGSRRYYIQSALSLADAEKEAQEKRPFRHLNDAFKKIVVVREAVKVRRDEFGVVTLGVLDFLLHPDSLEW